jgi:hypothetical protein
MVMRTLLLALALAPATAHTDTIPRFDVAVDLPAVVIGPPGSLVQFPATVQLIHADAPVTAWSLSIVSEDPDACRISGATTAGTVGARVTDTPPGLRDDGFETTGLAGDTETNGAVSLVFLNLDQPPTVSLAPDGVPYDLLRLSVQTTVPESGGCVLCSLRFMNDLPGSQGIVNAVVAGEDSQPTLFDDQVVAIGSGTRDCDENGMPDECDPDADADTIPDACDNCPDTANPGQEDADGAGAGDACDGCPDDANKNEPGECGCGVADTDADGNGHADACDETLCPALLESGGCDDGDACTIDGCTTPGQCQHEAVALAMVQSAVAAAVAPQACAAETLPRALSKALEKSRTLLDAAAGSATEEANRLVRRARKRLKRGARVLHRARRRIAAACVEVLAGHLGDARAKAGCL